LFSRIWARIRSVFGSVFTSKSMINRRLPVGRGIQRIHIVHVIHATHLLFRWGWPRTARVSPPVCADIGRPVSALRRAMFWNWATGRLVMVTAPMMTVRIAITIATMGRLMKNLDIWLLFPLHLGGACGIWLGIDLRSWTDFLHALGPRVTGFQPAR